MPRPDPTASRRRAPLLAAVGLAASAALPGGLAAADPKPEGASEGATRKVAIYLYPGVELLDFAGPGEVFAAASGFGASDQPAFEVYTVARTAEPITSQGFLEVVPDHGIDTAPRPDILVLPGGSSGVVLSDPEAMAWIGKSARAAEATLTVCTGAFMLAEAGLLDGLDVTTWYGALDRLASRYPKTRVQPGRRFIDSGSVITTAGVSAGIDGALHLVARLLGRSAADRTARYMEYGWTPEAYLADGYSQDAPGSPGASGRP